MYSHVLSHFYKGNYFYKIGCTAMLLSHFYKRKITFGTSFLKNRAYSHVTKPFLQSKITLGTSMYIHALSHYTKE